MITPEMLTHLPDDKLEATLDAYDTMYVISCSHHAALKELYESSPILAKDMPEMADWIARAHNKMITHAAQIVLIKDEFRRRQDDSPRGAGRYPEHTPIC